MQFLEDYQGYPIRLTEERLFHILNHPEMAIMESEITTTLKNSEQVRRSKSDATVLLNYRYYTRTLVGDKWLCVVVKYLTNDAFLLTAYLTDRIKKGEIIWQQP